jgi:phosphate:Na+ symporter
MNGLLLILGGLALFMFGLRMLSSGTEKLAGGQIQRWLDRVTIGRIRSALFGAAATAIIQSSGLLMVTMMGLINANLMTVEQSIAVMLGQEIGTTITAQIVAFDIGNFRLLLIILGIVLLEFTPNREWRKYGEISLGLGMVFVAMGFMSQALDDLVAIPWVAGGLLKLDHYPLLGVVAGVALTSLTQSSTAVTSMVVAMGMSHCITIMGAVGIILGANIGSCITGLIASFRLSQSARQASIAQIAINVIGVLLFLPFMPGYARLISNSSPDLPRQIANAHTVFNVTVSAILFPFVKQVGQLARWLAPIGVREEKVKLTAYIDEMQYSVPAVALNEAAREFSRLGDATAEMLEQSCLALIDKDTALAHKVMTLEDKFVDPVTKALVDFVNGLLTQDDLNVAQQKRCLQIKNLLIDIERVGDMAEDIAQYAVERTENDVPFSQEAARELRQLSAHVHQTYSMSLRAFRESDRDLARQACLSEREFDRLYWQTRQRHINRLAAGLCHPEADVIFTDTLRNLERVSDHADNLGVSVARS